MVIKQKLLTKLKPGSFLRSVVTVASGTVIAQAIAVLVSPIITRMYTPEDMGVLASYTAIVAILGVVSAGCYDQAIVLPKTNKESNAVSFAALIFSLFFSFIITIVTVLFNKPLIKLLKLQGDAASWLYLLGLFVFLTGFELVLSRIAIRNRHFRVIASTQITQQVSNNGIKIIWGCFSPGSIALFVSALFSTISRVVRLSIGEFSYLLSKEDHPTKQEVKQAALRFKKFPIISSWSGLLNTASVQMPVVLFTVLFSPSIAGFYSLSHRILSLPMVLIGSSVGNVFLERASKSKEDENELGRITLEIYKKLIFIGAIIMSFVSFYGDLLFSCVFGAQWLEAGKYAQWISIWLIFVFAASPLSIIYIVKEKQIESLIFNIILIISRVLAISIPFAIGLDSTTSVKVFAIVGFLMWIIWSIRILKIAGVSIKNSLFYTLFYPFGIYSLQFIFFIIVKKVL